MCPECARSLQKQSEWTVQMGQNIEKSRVKQKDLLLKDLEKNRQDIESCFE
jgi:hypothetical protein